MRAELEQVELIERYLLGDLSADEKAGFESQMNADASLSAKVNAQRSVMGAIKRIGVKTAAVSAYGGWKLRKWFKRISLVMIIGGGIGMSIFLIARRECVSCGQMESGDEMSINFFESLYYGVKCCEEDCVPCEPLEEHSGEGQEHSARPDNCCEETYVENGGEEFSNIGFEIQVEDHGGHSGEGHLEELSGEDQFNHGNNNQSNNVEFDDQGDIIENKDPMIVEFEMLDNADTTVTDNNTSTSNDEETVKKIFRPEDEVLDSMTVEETAFWEGLEVEPSFPGGNNALNQYLANNLEYPSEAQTMGIQGVVYISFTISKSGSIKNAKIARGVHEIIDYEALKVIKNMPNWKPGKMRGDNGKLKAVNVQHTIPVRFVLSGFESDL